jgi:O-antigen ligase
MIGAATARLTERGYRLPTWAIATLTIPTGTLLGWLLVTKPTLAFLPAALLLCIPLLISPRVRVVYIVFGGLLVFQSSDQLTTTKLLFLGGAAVAFVGALVHSRRFTRTAAYRDLLPLFWSSLAFAALLLVSFSVANFMGTSQKAWLRDVAPYVLFACAPLFALDAQTALSARALRRLLVAAGVVGVVFFGAQWLSNRGIANVSSAAVGLPTILLGGSLFAYAIAVVLEGRRGWLRWLVLASLVFIVLITTGTRSAAVLLAAPLAIVVGSRRRFTRRAVRLGVAIPLAALLIALGTQSLLKLVHANRSALETRIALVFHTGGSSDHSYEDRISQTKAAWRLFKHHPLLGTGLGYSIAWRDSFGRLTSSVNIDSPVAYVSKFGLLGIVPLVVFVAAFASFLRRLRWRTGGTTTTQLAVIGFGAIVAAWSLLQVPFEDKGLSSGLLLLFALAASEAASAATVGRLEFRRGRSR